MNTSSILVILVAISLTVLPVYQRVRPLKPLKDNMI